MTVRILRCIGLLAGLFIVMPDALAEISVDIGSDVNLNEGEDFTPSATITGETGDVAYEWSFGDGTATSSAASPTHAYGDNGFYTVTLTVTDDFISVSDSLSARVRNVTPTLGALADQTVILGSSTGILTFDFSDLGTMDTHTADIDWGDGSDRWALTVTELPFGPPGSSLGLDGSISTNSYTYSSLGVYTATITLADDDSALSSGTFTVTVIQQTTEELIGALVSEVIELNLQSGISNALDAKLDSVLSALEDDNANNDGAALNKMYAFCSSVYAQRGKKISDAEAERLLAAASAIITSIDEFAPACE